MARDLACCHSALRRADAAVRSAVHQDQLAWWSTSLCANRPCRRPAPVGRRMSRSFHRAQICRTETDPGRSGCQARVDPTRDAGSHRPTAHSGTGGGVPERSLAGCLRQTGRPCWPAHATANGGHPSGSISCAMRIPTAIARIISGPKRGAIATTSSTPLTPTNRMTDLCASNWPGTRLIRVTAML